MQARPLLPAAGPGWRLTIGTWLRARFPSRSEILSVVGVIVFAVHSWSVRGFLYDVPSFILKKPLGEIAAIFCYHMAFALFETALIVAALLVAAAILPGAWLRRGFPYKGFLLFVAAAAAAIILQDSPAYETNTFAITNDPSLPVKIGAAVGVCLVVYLLALWKPGISKPILLLVDQISVMLYIYLPLDIIALLVVGARLSGWFNLRT